MEKTSVYKQIDYLMNNASDLWERILSESHELIDTQDIFSFKSIKVIGCGDSNFSGIAVKGIFEELSGIATEVVEPIEFIDSSRYLNAVSYQKNQVLVIGISTSGNTEEVVKSIDRAKEIGFKTLGITTNVTSKLATNSDYHVAIELPEYKISPGIITYVYSMLVLSSLAIRFAEVKDRILMVDAANMRKNISLPYSKAMQVFKDTLTNLSESGFKNKYREIEFIGVSSSVASALYSCAKFYEMCGKRTTYINLGEWRHQSCFISDNLPLVSIVFVENEYALKEFNRVKPTFDKLERNYLIVSPKSLRLEGTLDYEDGKYEIFNSLYSFIPVLALAEIYTEALEEDYFRGFIGKWEGV